MLQVVHHLFPNICHTHYPVIAPIVVDTCREFRVPYKIYPSVSPTCIMLEAIAQEAPSCLLPVSPQSLRQPLVDVNQCMAPTVAVLTSLRLCLKYLCCLQFLSAMSAHFQHLKSMGSPNLVPSFSALG